MAGTVTNIKISLSGDHIVILHYIVPNYDHECLNMFSNEQFESETKIASRDVVHTLSIYTKRQMQTLRNCPNDTNSVLFYKRKMSSRRPLGTDKSFIIKPKTCRAVMSAPV